MLIAEKPLKSRVKTANYALLSPSLEESAVSSVLTEIVNLQTGAKEDTQKLAECLEIRKQNNKPIHHGT